ncbi:hypothetical protein [Pseudodesulfovibrio sp.]|uniref:hypothetical protein n=1 Tax=Pseudodesulfovibrio sp. TaxID=2035812 RepID=UPI002607C659|nr:hypothetical protein [Pseudodesulfovibrio sp.]MDD3312622.1 hypothetical protein [Pseudodesulfovibrio sp.]
MAYNPPSSVQGAKKAISTRTKQLQLAKAEGKRQELSDEINRYVNYIYKYAKAGEQAAKALENGNGEGVNNS